MKIADFIGEVTEYKKKERLEERKPKSWLKSVSAFANGVGGVLVFAVADDDTLVGLTNANRWTFFMFPMSLNTTVIKI